jgi:hypothetical protein
MAIAVEQESRRRANSFLKFVGRVLQEEAGSDIGSTVMDRRGTL